MKRQVLEIIQNNKRWLIVIVALLFLNIISSIGIGLFQAPALERKRAAWTEQRKKLDALARGDVTAAFRNAGSDLVKLREMIPPKRDFPLLLGEIMEASAQCGVSSDSIDYKPDYLKEWKLLTYEINMSVSGSYSGVRCFLYEMQTREQLVVVDGISVSNKDPYMEDITMSIRMTAYLRDGA